MFQIEMNRIRRLPNKHLHHLPQTFEKIKRNPPIYLQKKKKTSDERHQVVHRLFCRMTVSATLTAVPQSKKIKLISLQLILP